MRSSSLVFLAFVALSPASCKRTKGDSAPKAGSVAALASSAPSPASDATKRLALAKTDGLAPVDAIIKAQEAILEKLPEKADAWIILGRAWVQKARETGDPGFYRNADACAAAVLDFDPENKMALGLRAQVLLNDHAFDEARSAAEHALAVDKDDLVALAVLSDAELELGHYDEATDAAQRMMDLKPSLPSYIRASYLKWLHGDFEGAKEAARQALEGGVSKRDPEPQAWASVQAAMLFWSVGDYDGANAGFDRALGIVADFPAALAGKGRVALAKGDSKRAVELLAKSYAKTPLVETAWLLGDACTMAGDAEGAKQAYDLVVKDGRRIDKRTLAAFYATKNRDIDEALRLITEESKTRGGIITDDVMAWTLYRANKLPEAKAASDKAMRLGTKDATILYHAGAIRIATGDKADGEKLVREALELNPKFDVTGAAEAAALVAK